MIFQYWKEGNLIKIEFLFKCSSIYMTDMLLVFLEGVTFGKCCYGTPATSAGVLSGSLPDFVSGWLEMSLLLFEQTF